MKELQTIRMSYPAECLAAWRQKDCRILITSDACDYIKAILTSKVYQRSGGRRFFGEAYVATQIKHQEGFYGSFKWLTNTRFSQDRPFPNGPMKKFKEELRGALLKYFGKKQLDRLHNRAHTVAGQTGNKPVPPDLWLIDQKGNHRFIEVKLPGDRIHPAQRVGMALIKSCLHPRARLLVEVVELCPEPASGTHLKTPIKTPADKRLQWMAQWPPLIRSVSHQ